MRSQVNIRLAALFLYLACGLVARVWAAPPPNDNFADAKILPGTPNSITISAFNATSEPGEPPLPGNPGSVWYSWTPASDAKWTIAVDRTSFGGYLAVFTGETLQSLSAVVSAELAPGVPAAILVAVKAGEPLHIRLAGSFNIQAAFGLRFFRPPPNDDFTAPEPLEPGSAVGAATFAATREPGEPNENKAQRTLWWKWTPLETGSYWLEYPASQTGVFFEVYEGETLSALNRAPNQTTTEGANRKQTFRATEGRTYAIALCDTSIVGQDAGFSLRHIAESDDWRNARPIILGQSVTNSTAGATSELGEPVIPSGGGATVWQVWRATASAGFAARARSGFGCVAAVYSGDSLSSLTLLASGLPATAPEESTATFQAREGELYYVAVDALGTSRGPYSIMLTPTAPNDDFANRQELTGLPTESTVPLFLATSEPGEPVHGDLAGAASLWWKWTATTSATVEVSVRHRLSPSALAVYTGSELPNLQLVASAPSSMPKGDQLRILQFRAKAGTEYLIAFAQPFPTPGSVTLSLQPGPPNDDFAKAVLLEGLKVSTSILFRGATLEPDEPTSPGPGDGSLWWMWIAPKTGTFMATIESSLPAWRGSVYVYSGTGLSNLELAYDNRFTHAAVRSPFHAVLGQTYFIAVKWNSDDVPIPLTLRLFEGPANDEFAYRESVVGTTVTATGTTLGATVEPDETVGLGNSSVWYSWKAPLTGFVFLSISSLDANTKAGVFSGSRLGSLVSITNTFRYPEIKRLRFTAEQGTEYQITIASPVLTGAGFSFQLIPAPPYDDFKNRLRLSGTNLSVPLFNLNATFEAGEFPLTNSIWASWTAPADGTVQYALTPFDAPVSARAKLFYEPANIGTNRLALLPTFTEWVFPYDTRPSTNRFAVTAGTVYDFLITSATQSTNLNLTLAFNPTPPLGDEWLRYGIQWRRGGSAPWFAQSKTAHDTAAALQPGDVPSGENSWLQGSVTGPSRLSFWWKIDSAESDYLVFETSADISGKTGPNSYNASITGKQGWTNKVVTLPLATNIVRWTYLRDPNRKHPAAPATAWLDQITVTPLEVLPFSFLEPFITRDGDIVLAAEVQKIQNYQMQTSTNLVDWVPAGDYFSSVHSALQFRRPFQATNPAVFFRLLVPKN